MEVYEDQNVDSENPDVIISIFRNRPPVEETAFDTGEYGHITDEEEGDGRSSSSLSSSSSFYSSNSDEYSRRSGKSSLGREGEDHSSFMTNAESLGLSPTDVAARSLSPVVRSVGGIRKLEEIEKHLSKKFRGNKQPKKKRRKMNDRLKRTGRASATTKRVKAETPRRSDDAKRVERSPTPKVARLPDNHEEEDDNDGIFCRDDVSPCRTRSRSRTRRRSVGLKALWKSADLDSVSNLSTSESDSSQTLAAFSGDARDED